jgi:hypothetical protein
MKNTKLLLGTLLTLASTATYALESRRELMCDIEEKLSIKETQVFRESLMMGTIVDHYKNLESTVEPLLVKARVLVKKNCLEGKPPSAVAAQLTSLWADGCKDIVNPALNPICIRFRDFNHGTNVGLLMAEIPSLATLLAPQPGADCTAGVTDSNSRDLPEADAEDLSRLIQLEAAPR